MCKHLFFAKHTFFWYTLFKVGVMMTNKNRNKNIEVNNDINKSIISLFIIAIYFIWPYFINLFNFTKYNNLIEIILNMFLVLVLLFIYRKDFVNDFIMFKEAPGKCIKKLLINLLLMILSVAILNILITLCFSIETISGNEQALYQIFEKNPLVLVLLTVVYYPILEGIVFRKTIRNIISDKYLFIIVTCLLYFFFNIVYAPFSVMNILSSLSYLVLMFYMSKIYWDTNNFTLSIILSMLYNIFVTLIAL